MVYIGYALGCRRGVWHVVIIQNSQVGVQQTHGLLVARLVVIGAQGLYLSQLAANHAQHVVAKDGGIGAHHHKRLKRALLGLGQQLAHLGR